SGRLHRRHERFQLRSVAVLATAVTVIVGGAVIEGSTPATIRAGVVVAPIAPYLRRIAERIESDPGGTRFTFERGGRTFSVIVGSPLARSADAAETLPIAPYVRAGKAFIPLAAVARALGGEVAYDAASRTLSVELRPEPLATMTPYVPSSPLPQPLVTFAPTSTPAPAVEVTGIPKPRRTPAVVEDPQR
ncbi:MAG: copper amine oxidase N-terminal domain-containing protein, partial [Candidatus Eremiobacteraeota bacterium]|nr:copper amine oxidase N-terminal domain-containing protein [Candidatus Eremiobacteraeota bacterium]